MLTLPRGHNEFEIMDGLKTLDFGSEGTERRNLGAGVHIKVFQYSLQGKHVG